MKADQYRKQLIEQFNKTQTNLEHLRGAIAACDALIAAEDDELLSTDESDD